MTTTHGCPGCGVLIGPSGLACVACWYLLPADIRDEVNRAYRCRMNDPARHRAAIIAVIEWYREERSA